MFLNRGWDKTPFDTVDPFIGALAFAREHNWEIAGLDKLSHQKIHRDIEHGVRTHPLPSEYRYSFMDSRDRAMAIRAKIRLAGNGDVILMHPDHIEGFLADSGFNSNNVEWIHLPRDEDEGYRRLSKEKIATLEKSREWQRKQRKPEAFEAPKQPTFGFMKGIEFWGKKGHVEKDAAKRRTRRL